MTVNDEASARRYLTETLAVSSGDIQALEHFAVLLREEASRQNLIARSTLDEALWSRHFVDSAQLLPLAASVAGGRWLDIGSGAGLPGLVVALLAPRFTVHLVEPRRLRVQFLRQATEALGLGARVIVHETVVEALVGTTAAVISARAFAPLPRLIDTSRHCADENTIWLLPKGKNALREFESVHPAWQKRFHVERSVTDAEAHVLVGTGDFSAPVSGGKRR